MGDAGLANQSKTTLMTVANAAAAAAAASAADPQEPVLLVAVEVETRALEEHATHIREVVVLIDSVIGQLTRTREGGLDTPVSTDMIVAATADLSVAHRQQNHHVSAIEKLQIRLDGLRIKKEQTEARDARKDLIGKSLALLEEADKSTPRLKATKDLLASMSEIHGLLAEYAPEDSGILLSPRPKTPPHADGTMQLSYRSAVG